MILPARRALLSPRVSVLVLLAVIAGCGKVSLLPTVPVTGIVTYKGQGVADAHIAFIPADHSSGKPATAVADARGRFTAQTHVGGSQFAVGALAGDYLVTVTQGLPTHRDAPIMSASEWSKLSKEERTKSAGRATMPKISKPGETPKDPAGASTLESKLPLKYADTKTPLLRASVKTDGTNDFTFDLKD